MNESDNKTTQEISLPTKLSFFSSSQDQSQSIREHLSSLPDLIQKLDYKFSFEMPTVHVLNRREETPIIEKYINWRGKERERKIFPPSTSFDYQHYLQFSKELSTEELDFWRIIKLGFLCRDFEPNGVWRKS